MRRVLPAVLTAVLFLAARGAFADEPEATQKTDRTPVWSVGAGIGFGVSYVYGMSGYGGSLGGMVTDEALAGLGSTTGYGGLGYGCLGCGFGMPQGMVLVERLLGESAALMLRVSAGTSDREYGTANLSWAYKRETTNLGIDAGLRWIFNPGGIVEVATYISLGGSWYWSEYTSLGGSGDWWKSDGYSYSIGLTAGLVLERELLDRLYLRLTSSLAGLSYSWSESKYTDSEGPEPKSNSNTITGGLVFSPAIQLRFLF